MRIGFFVEMYRPHTSGIVVSLDRLIQERRTKGDECFIFTPSVPGYQDSQDLATVIRLASYSFHNYCLAKPKLDEGLIDTVSNLNLDLIHIQGVQVSCNFGVKLGKKLNIPVIMTYHTDFLSWLKSWTTVWNWPLSFALQTLYIPWVRYIAHQCQLIIAPSQHTKRQLEGFGVKSRIEVLPSPIDIPIGLPNQMQARKELELPSNPQILLYVGRITREKNLKMLIEAFEYVTRDKKNVVLVLVGEGDDRSRLEKIVMRKRLSKKVYFVGAVAHETVNLYYVAADIFVFPSWTETQGLAVLEAMAARLPVVVVNMGGSCEFVDNGHNGFVVETKPKHFAEAILHLLSDSTLSSCLGSNGQQIVRQINLIDIDSKVDEYYKEVISLTRV